MVFRHYLKIILAFCTSSPYKVQVCQISHLRLRNFRKKGSKVFASHINNIIDYYYYYYYYYYYSAADLKRRELSGALLCSTVDITDHCPSQFPLHWGEPDACLKLPHGEVKAGTSV